MGVLGPGQAFGGASVARTSRTPIADGGDQVGSVPATTRRLRIRYLGELPARWTWLPSFVITLAALVVAWPFRTYPLVGVDLSWHVALHQAFTDGLRYGRDIVFTYGPLGFLGRPTPFVGPTSALAFVSVAALLLVAGALIVGASRRLFPLPLAALAALVFGRVLIFVQPFEVLQWLAFALGVALLRPDRVDRRGWLPVAAAGLVAIAVLGKVDVGAFLAAGAAVVVLAISPRRPRDLTIYLVSLAAWVVGGWLALGQQPLDLVAYGRDSVDIISGYSDAMGVVHPGLRWLAGAFAVLAALLVAVTYQTSRAWARPRRLALAGLLGVLLFALWKQGFVRDHFEASFAALALTVLLMTPRSLPRWGSAAVLVAAVVGVMAAAETAPARYLDIPASVGQLSRQARVSLLPWRWDAAASRTRSQLQAAFKVPPDIVAQLAGRTVAIEPYLAAVPTAYPGFAWRPEPVFQSYSAYTPYLDELNADLLRSPDRPERILRHFSPRTSVTPTIPHDVNARNYWFEAPAATLERLCRYREIAAGATWQLLADTGLACGPSHVISTVAAARGEAVPVPAAPATGDIVIVRVHGLDDGLVGRVRSTLWKGPEWQATLDGVRYRLVAATAGDGLVLSVPASAQGSVPFQFGNPIRTISIRQRGSSGGGELTYEFEAVPLPSP
jgi:hypothetical protein